MTDRLKIPTCALLGLSFGGGCSPDGIVGTWRATERSGMPLPMVEMEGNEKVTTEGTLIIGEDLKGELRIRQLRERPGVKEHTGYDVEIAVSAMDDFFLVTAIGYYYSYYDDEEEDVPFMLCDLEEDTLECDSLADEAEEFKFTRA